MPFDIPTQKGAAMSSHMPPVPPANRSNKGPKDDTKPAQDTSMKHPEPQNVAECGIRGIADRIPTQAGQRSDDYGQPMRAG